MTPQDMMDLQLDTLDVRARLTRPVLLAALEGDPLSAEEAKGVELVRMWDLLFLADREAPVLFDEWWSELARSLWTDYLGPEDQGLRIPSRDVTLHRVLHPEAWDQAGNGDSYVTEKIRAAYHAAFALVAERLGPPGKSWAWGVARGTEIRHLARIPGFSRLGLETPGRAGVINATSRRFGPSWRMVVALGPEVEAWGIFPGGESGNPGSPHYDSFVDDWVDGKMYELHFLRTADDEQAKSMAATALAPEAQR